MIEINEKMKEQSQKRFNEACEKVDAQINCAVENNKTSCYFACDMDGDSDVYYKVKQAYTGRGYHVQPTGYIGGVWQRTENICW